MTKSIYATLYARLGDADKALFWWRDSYLPNLNPPFREARNKALIHDSRFLSNTASTAGAAVEALAFDVLDVQRCAFISNTATTHGALDIVPSQASAGAHILNCSFLDNTLNAKKGLATATKKYGGAA